MKGLIQRLATVKIPLVLRSREAFNGDGLRMKRILAKDRGYVALAVIISKKVDKRASVRNRIRRIVKAAVLNLYNDGLIPDGDYAILIAEGTLSELKTEDIEKRIEKMLP